MAEPVSDRCPRCGLPRTRTVEGSGICLRCLGERALAFAASNDVPGAPATKLPNSFDTSSHLTPSDAGLPASANDASSAPKDMLTAAPRQLGAYELVEEIGRGG